MQSGSPAGPDSPFLDTITIADWLRDSSITEASRKNRARMIHSLEKANGATVEKIVEAVKAGEASPYAASRKFVDAIRPTLAPMTVRGQRSMLPVFWESVLGEARFSRRTFDRLVPMGASWASRPKLSPNRDRFVLMLKASKPNP